MVGLQKSGSYLIQNTIEIFHPGQKVKKICLLFTYFPFSGTVLQTWIVSKQFEDAAIQITINPLRKIDALKKLVVITCAVFFRVWYPFRNVRDLTFFTFVSHLGHFTTYCKLKKIGVTKNGFVQFEAHIIDALAKKYSDLSNTLRQPKFLVDVLLCVFMNLVSEEEIKKKVSKAIKKLG